MFKEVDSRMNLPKTEEEVLNFWDKNKIFEKTIENRKDAKLYSFYDGPPFATGTPHYGHLLGSTMKDIVPRYWTMKGYKVPRKWGWDCHGLPIENIAEKELGYTHKKDIEELGVDKFNAICRSKVLGYVAEWKKVIRRLGRWVDMENAYSTMDLSYMESVWWVFKNLYDKGLIYEGYRSMHICPRCETTLSQSEVTEGYKTVKDLSAIAKFEIVDEPGTYFLAWTTTPWTLIGNVALAVGNDIDYVKVQSANMETGEAEQYILAKSRLEAIMKDREYEVLEESKGRGLTGIEYQPVFDHYLTKGVDNKENGWKVYSADFVTTEDGTGIVHIAPAFGEEDMKLGEKYNLPFVQHIGMDGIIKADVPKFAGMHVKDIEDTQRTDIEVIKDLAHRNLLFFKEKYEHSYPHCWRCDTPLLNYATSSWFVSVTKLKKDALRLAKKINWSPKHIKEGRFGKWLEGARDWSISRQRFWASVMPIWRCSCGENQVFGSIDELRKVSKQKITKLIFVRHGESEKNVLRVHSNTKHKWSLTEKGREDAQFIADSLCQNIDLIISSPILRASETAEIISKKYNIPIVYDDLITEYDYGLWNDKSREELADDEHHVEYQKIKHIPEKRFHHKLGKYGESRADVIVRVKKFLDKINQNYRGKTVLIVSHGGINAAIHKILHSINYEQFFIKEDIDHREYEEFYIGWDGKPFDLHKDVVDDITVSCPKCGEHAKRIPDVLDTWFDSGSMPFAQIHYPFENKKLFAKISPTDYIAEYDGQCRAWFYYLHIISTAITGNIAFKNALVSGTVLAEDGKKMSKRLQNYPDPTLMFEKYGADVMRFYLTISSVMQAENLNFSEKEMAELSRGMFRMLWNSYSFFVLYANIDKWSPSADKRKGSSNLLDKWIISELNKLVAEVNIHMEVYDPMKAARLFSPFIDNLSNWYIRRSRKRFWKSENDKDKASAYQTLWTVLVELSKLLAPFVPFIADEIYKNLTSKESVHLEEYPQANKEAIDDELNLEMNQVRKIVELGLANRALSKIKIRQPLQSLCYHGKKLVSELEDIVADEVNIKEVKNTPGDHNIIEIDTKISDALLIEGYAREIIRNIQTLRKSSGFNVEDRINVLYKTDSADLEKAIKSEIVAKEVLALSIKNEKLETEGDALYNIDGQEIWIGINR